MKKIFLILFVLLSNILMSQSVMSDKMVYDFGVVKYDSDTSCIFKLTNISNSVVSITECKPSCGCVVPTCPIGEIKPKQSVYIKIDYDFKREGPINKSITIYLSDPNQEVLILRIRGMVLKKSE